MTVINENGLLKVGLSEAETIHYSVNELLFSGGTAFGAALMALYENAAAKSGFKTSAETLCVEIYPSQNGGCEVWFCPDKRRRIKLRAVACKTANRLTAEFHSSSALIGAISFLSQYKSGCPYGVLYGYGRCYRLITFPCSRSEMAGLKARLMPFADRIFDSAAAAAATEEHCEMLCDDAIEKIGAVIKAL